MCNFAPKVAHEMCGSVIKVGYKMCDFGRKLGIKTCKTMYIRKIESTFRSKGQRDSTLVRRGSEEPVTMILLRPTEFISANPIQGVCQTLWHTLVFRNPVPCLPK